MANDSLKLSFRGKSSKRRVEQLEARWLTEKLKPKPWNRNIAYELRKARAQYRDKYRPALPPNSGVTL